MTTAQDCKPNQKFDEKSGRCIGIPKKSVSSSKVKSRNNPFKMWGSWIGAIPGMFFVFYFSYYAFIVGGEAGMAIIAVPPALFIALFGFLIGWGITYAHRNKDKKSPLSLMGGWIMVILYLVYIQTFGLIGLSGRVNPVSAFFSMFFSFKFYLFLVIAFLIGWGIQVLIRQLRKK